MTTWKEGEDTTNKMLNMQVKETRRRDTPKRWLHNITDDMEEYNMKGDMAQNRTVCHMRTNARPVRSQTKEAYM